jgi:hypothetical protein
MSHTYPWNKSLYRVWEPCRCTCSPGLEALRAFCVIFSMHNLVHLRFCLTIFLPHLRIRHLNLHQTMLLRYLHIKGFKTPPSLAASGEDPSCRESSTSCVFCKAACSPRKASPASLSVLEADTSRESCKLNSGVATRWRLYFHSLIRARCKMRASLDA